MKYKVAITLSILVSILSLSGCTQNNEVETRIEEEVIEDETSGEIDYIINNGVSTDGKIILYENINSVAIVERYRLKNKEYVHLLIDDKNYMCEFIIKDNVIINMIKYEWAGRLDEDK